MHIINCSPISCLVVYKVSRKYSYHAYTSGLVGPGALHIFVLQYTFGYVKNTNRVYVLYTTCGGAFDLHLHHCTSTCTCSSGYLEWWEVGGRKFLVSPTVQY